MIRRNQTRTNFLHLRIDSLLSISEMPTGSPVVSVGVNKAANAGIYAMKILANEYPALKRN